MNSECIATFFMAFNLQKAREPTFFKEQLDENQNRYSIESQGI
jgi:hypothetical protein